ARSREVLTAATKIHKDANLCEFWRRIRLLALPFLEVILRVLPFILACALPCLAAAAQTAEGEQFARVGANALAWECRGSGSKTIVLIEGQGLDAHATFKNTFRNLSVPGYQVCLYDRAGVGHSTPVTAARPLKAL